MRKMNRRLNAWLDDHEVTKFLILMGLCGSSAFVDVSRLWTVWAWSALMFAVLLSRMFAARSSR